MAYSPEMQTPTSPPAPPPRAASLRHPDRWLAALRVVVGLWFLKSLWTKLQLAPGALPLPRATERWVGFMPRRVEEWAATHPWEPVRAFLTETVLARPALFAELTAWGEALVGVSLTLGLLAGWGAAGGLFLMLTYLLSSLGTGLNQQGFHILLIACLVAFLFARAGRVWGVDGWLLRERPRLARRLPLV
jgi:thiosulfate dehydrogenase (quinone) large subunit